MRYLLLSMVAVFCVTTSFAQLNVSSSISPISCFGGSDGIVTANVTGGTPPYTYTWVMNGNPIFVTDPTVTNLPASVLFVYVSDNVGATGGDTIELFDPAPWSINTTETPSDCGQNNGTITLSVIGGVAPYTYTWNNGSTTANQNQVSSGFYIVTITDGNGCSATAASTVPAVGNLTVNTTVQYDSCQGTACITVVPIANATYTWSNGALGQQICGLPDGTYNVTVTDGSGCSGIAVQTVTNVTVLQAVAASTPASCGSDGSVIATATDGLPPYTYLWNTADNTAQVSNLPAGNYTVTITDDNGCSTTATTVIANGNFVVDSVVVTQATCQSSSDGSATLFVTGSNPPFTYTWSGGTTSNVLTGLSAGTYSITITDAGGCILVQSFNVSIDNLQITTGSVSPTNCFTGLSGSIFAEALNGQAPYTYTWSNGSTGDTITGLGSGGYTVTVTDASGCSAIRHQFVSSSYTCYAKVMGRVFVDADTDCNNTSNDVGVLNARVTTGGYTNGYTNINGDWVAYLQAGVYNLKVLNVGNLGHLSNACGVDSITITVLDTSTILEVDFPKSTTAFDNVGVYVNCSVARPGFNFTATTTISNYGFSVADGHGSVILDPVFSSISSYTATSGIVIDSVSTTLPKTVYYSYTGLQPQSTGYIYIVAPVPLIPTVLLGQIISNSATIELDNNTDLSTDNNNSVCSTTIIGSYDPNDKQVFNANNESIDGNATPEDTLLHYLIRFQNTGTDTAFTVVVRDTLDEHLNISSFRFIAASHDVEIEFYEERIVHFVFNNILLPDSNVNEPASHGFIEFDIEVLDKTQLDEVSNQAAIYFDFNPPIFTNTVTTSRIVGITETVKIPVHIFPNPTAGNLSVNLGGLPIEQVEMYDVMGRKVLQQSASNTLQANIDATNLGSGIYIIRIQSGGAWYQERVVISK